MNAIAAPEVLSRWAIRAADCTITPDVEGIEHSRYLLSAHAGHGGCAQYLGAMGYESVVMG